MSWIEGTGNVFDQLVVLQQALISNKGRASAYPVDSMGEFPFWQNMLVEGTVQAQSKGWMIGTHTIRSELHLMRGVLKDNEKELRKYVQPFYAAVMADLTLAGTVTQVQNLSYRLTAWEYSPQDKHVGIEFTLSIEMKPEAR